MAGWSIQMMHIDASRRKSLWLGALLVVATLLLYLPVVHHDFISGWDDDDYVTANVHVRSGLQPANVVWAFTSFEQSNWHPVTWLSHMLDCQIFGLNPGPHHSVNVLLHAANVFLLFWILQRSTKAVWRSFIVAALFAVHPLNVETVAWVAQRKSLLSALFSLLTIAAYGLYVQRGGWKRYLAVAGAFALALMSKPMAVSLPLLLLLFDYWPLDRFEGLARARRWGRLAIEKLPLLCMSAASSVLTEMAQHSGGSVMQLSMLPLSTRIGNAIVSYVGYLGKILWPVRLSTFYPLEFSRPLGDIIASATILIAITAIALYFHRRPYLAMGWLFFVITLFPVIGVVQVGFQGMADRYTYIPSIGLFIAITWGLASMAEQLPMARVALSVAALCLVSAFAAATVHYLPYWQNGVTLFSRARTAYGRPHFWLEQLYANALLSSGQVDAALEHYEESCAIQPRTEYCHYSIAHILLSRHQFRDAIAEYELALQYTANPQMALLCLNEAGEAHAQLGEYDAAQVSFAEALKIDPGNAATLRLRERMMNNLGAQN